MNSYEYIEKAKIHAGLTTDYSLGKRLGWSRQKISNYKRGQTMDNEAAREIAELLNTDVWVVIADMEIQRAKKESSKKAWRNAIKRLEQAGNIAPNLLIINGFLSSIGSAICILC